MRQINGMALATVLCALVPGMSGESAWRDSLRARLAPLEKGRPLVLGADTIRPPTSDLQDFYRRRDYRPGWILPGPAAFAMLDAASKSHLEGLEPREYHAQAIDSLLRLGPRPGTPAALDLELRLSDSFLRLGRHLLYGRMRPKNLGHPCRDSGGRDLPALLASTLDRGASVASALKKLAPQDEEYGRLKYWLAHYRPLAAAQAEGEARNRFRALRLALEYRRWLPRDAFERHIRVNIADFRLSAHGPKGEELDMRVVVGRLSDRTPVFYDHVAAVVLNPYWNVPTEIAVSEILPQAEKDKDHLRRNNMELLASWAQNAPVLPLDSLRLPFPPESTFTKRLRQLPGPGNALGRVKFELTNPMNIYLHDTPQPELFDRERRAFSHGCIRVEKPLELAAWVLAPDTAWTLERVQAAVATEKTRVLPVGCEIPVYILYWTAWADAQGLHFRPDVYGLDRQLEKAWKQGSYLP